MAARLECNVEASRHSLQLWKDHTIPLDTFTENNVPELKTLGTQRITRLWFRGKSRVPSSRSPKCILNYDDGARQHQDNELPESYMQSRA